MLQKHPKPAYRKFIKRGAVVVFVAEAVCFAVSYAAWYRLNTSRDSRLYMYKNYYPILDSYYKFGELLDSKRDIRGLDRSIWTAEGKI